MYPSPEKRYYFQKKHGKSKEKPYKKRKIYQRK